VGNGRVVRHAPALGTLYTCGHKGASLSHPGWVDKYTGFAPFPTEASG